MIHYVPTSGSVVAEQLSVALWRLSSPEASERDTLRLFPALTCLDGSVWLAVDASFTIPVHAEASLGVEIEEILMPWIQEGYLPPEALAELASLVVAHRGHDMHVWQAFPSLFHHQSRTRQQLITAGLLAAD